MERKKVEEKNVRIEGNRERKEEKVKLKIGKRNFV